MKTSTTLATSRLDIRLSKEQKDLIRFASELKGFKSLSEFIIDSVSSRAKEIIKDNDVFLKTIEDKKIFVEALINPPAPNKQLKKALSDYNKFIKSNED